jgi:hypothetical protein
MGGSASIVGGILVVVLTEPPRSESIHLTVRDPDGQTATSSLTVNILPLPDLIGLIPDLSFDVDSFAEVALDEFVASDNSPPPRTRLARLGDR